jgi:hypothetical protein
MTKCICLVATAYRAVGQMILRSLALFVQEASSGKNRGSPSPLGSVAL